MTLSPLLPGHTELLETEIDVLFSKKRTIPFFEENLFFKNPFQVKKCNRIPLARLIRQLGSGPFRVERIILPPTQRVYFEIRSKDGVVKKINVHYFTKGTFIRRYWKTYWKLWNLMFSIKRVFYK